jgi:catechol 2,3-dioxygenase-like lactoylglutathione lyase family enzyme
MGTIFSKAVPYAGDVLSLPVRKLEEALPFYQTVMGFRVVSQSETPQKSAILARDQVQIGLAENGGDPEQNGCFFEVDNVESAFADLKSRGLKKEEPEFRIDKYGETSWRVFFVVAPDGLCYCLGQRHNPA